MKKTRPLRLRPADGFACLPGWLLRILVAFSTTLCSANAADPEFHPQVWLNPGVFSHHFDRSGNFREDNIGLGAEVLLAPDHGLMAGTFINSAPTGSRNIVNIEQLHNGYHVCAKRNWSDCLKLSWRCISNRGVWVWNT